MVTITDSICNVAYENAEAPGHFVLLGCTVLCSVDLSSSWLAGIITSRRAARQARPGDGCNADPLCSSTLLPFSPSSHAPMPLHLALLQGCRSFYFSVSCFRVGLGCKGRTDLATRYSHCDRRGLSPRHDPWSTTRSSIFPPSRIVTLPRPSAYSLVVSLRSEPADDLASLTAGRRGFMYRINCDRTCTVVRTASRNAQDLVPLSQHQRASINIRYTQLASAGTIHHLRIMSPSQPTVRHDHTGDRPR